jgi:hypothetical protein
VVVSAAEVKFVAAPLVGSLYVDNAATIAPIELVETVAAELVGDSPGCGAADVEFVPDSSNFFPGVAVASGKWLLVAHPETKLAARAAHKPKEIVVFVGEIVGFPVRWEPARFLR